MIIKLNLMLLMYYFFLCILIYISKYFNYYYYMLLLIKLKYKYIDNIFYKTRRVLFKYTFPYAMLIELINLREPINCAGNVSINI